MLGSKQIGKETRRLAERVTETPLEAMMAAIFLLLAVIVGVVLGDALLANTGSASVDLFDRSITDFTQGQLLLMAAGLGFLFALFLFMAWGASSSRRAKRRERRLIQRDLESRVHELGRENVSLRDELDQTTRTSRFSDSRGEPDIREREPALAMRQRERMPGDRDNDETVRDRLGRGDRVEEPARPEHAEAARGARDSYSR